MINLSTFGKDEQIVLEIFRDLNINRPGMLLAFEDIEKHWVHRGNYKEKLIDVLNNLTLKEYLVFGAKNSYVLADRLFKEKIFFIPDEYELQKAVVNIFRELRCKVGDSLMFSDFRIKWIDRGFQPNELKETLEKMIVKDFLEFNNTGTITLTQTGYNEFAK